MPSGVPRARAFPNLITVDMGGTSTDVCLVERGKAELAAQTTVDGLPVRTPLFDINSVGAGCGSIVWVDDGSALRVGPRSAGADPGPACYGRGGLLPTITDAHVVRGTIRPAAFLGGRMKIDAAAARRAFEPLAAHFGMSVEALAGRAIRIAEASMVRAIELVSTQRGRDPRGFTLVAFGGAGGLHAATIADELGVPTVLVPAYAGVLSAYGLLIADYVCYDTETRRIPLDDGAPESCARRSTRCTTAPSAKWRASNSRNAHPNSNLTLGMRFIGQSHEIEVEIAPLELPSVSAAVSSGRLCCGTPARLLPCRRPRPRRSRFPETRRRVAASSHPSWQRNQHDGRRDFRISDLAERCASGLPLHDTRGSFAWEPQRRVLSSWRILPPPFWCPPDGQWHETAPTTSSCAGYRHDARSRGLFRHLTGVDLDDVARWA